MTGKVEFVKLKAFVLLRLFVLEQKMLASRPLFACCHQAEVFNWLLADL